MSRVSMGKGIAAAVGVGLVAAVAFLVIDDTGTEGSEAAGEAEANDPAPERETADPVAATEQSEEAGTKAAVCAELVEPCHERHRQWGEVSGRVIADVAASGDVEDARYEGDARVDVRECILTSVGQRRIDDYEGEPITVTCQYSGSITANTRMLMMDWTLAPR